MNKMTVFDNVDFGNVRVAMINDNPYFCLSDVCKSLGLTSTSEVKRNLDEDGVSTTEVIDSLNRKQNATFIDESNLYQVIFQSRKPEAGRFKKWVTSEVLPTIRKTGGYVNNDDLFIDTYLSNVDDHAKLMFRQTLETVRSLNSTIEQQKPLVDFANKVGNSSDCILIRQLSKLANDEGINIGEKKLFTWMKENSYMNPKNEPYQKYITQGLFKLKETSYSTAYGDKLTITPTVTGKGQIYFIEKLRSTFK